MAYLATGLPIDWTNGTGVFPSGGVITLPANPLRKWLYVQNQDTTAVSVAYQGVDASDDATAASPTIVLAVAASSGAAGGYIEHTLQRFVPVGSIVITGTAGKKIAVMEG